MYSLLSMDLHGETGLNAIIFLHRLKLYGPPADKRDLITFCNMLSYTHINKC